MKVELVGPDGIIKVENNVMNFMVSDNKYHFVHYEGPRTIYPCNQFELRLVKDMETTTVEIQFDVPSEQVDSIILELARFISRFDINAVVTKKGEKNG